MNKNKIRVSILGAGWLGLAVGKSLIKQGYHVNGSTTTSGKMESMKRMGIQPYLVDSGNPSYILPAKFLHTDWLVICLPPVVMRDSLERLTSELKNIELKILLISSTAVYPGTGSVVTEADAIHQTSSHSGIDMLHLENEISGLGPVSILRLGGLYGSDRHPGRFLAGKNGLANGNAPVNLIHQEDAVNICCKIIAGDHTPCILNGVAPEHPSREVFYSQAAKAAGLQTPEFSGKNTNDFKIVDSSRLINELNYKFLHPDPLQDL